MVKLQARRLLTAQETQLQRAAAVRSTLKETQRVRLASKWMDQNKQQRMEAQVAVRKEWTVVEIQRVKLRSQRDRSPIDTR